MISKHISLSDLCPWLYALSSTWHVDIHIVWDVTWILAAFQDPDTLYEFITDWPQEKYTLSVDLQLNVAKRDKATIL